jgi:hypothetical protein
MRLVGRGLLYMPCPTRSLHLAIVKPLHDLARHDRPVPAYLFPVYLCQDPIAPLPQVVNPHAFLAFDAACGVGAV